MITTYKRKVQYYETDKMTCTHHANYIHFMEEARVDYLEKLGYSYLRTEREGLMSPVVSVSLSYKKPTTFGDEIEIDVKLTDLTPVKMTIGYEMRCKGEIVCTASSTHCYIDAAGRPVSMKRSCPELYELYLKALEK